MDAVVSVCSAMKMKVVWRQDHARKAEVSRGVLEEIVLRRRSSLWSRFLDEGWQCRKNRG